MRSTWPGASGCKIGSGIGAGGSAWAVVALNDHATTNAPRVARRVGVTRGSQFGGQQLGYLNCVQRSTFSQVVTGHEQRKSSTSWHAGILPDPADE